MKRKTVAGIFALCQFALCLFIVAWLSDAPLKIKAPAGKTKIAAIAIRDHVIPFQKFGTRLFSLPYLEKCYNRVGYFTQSGHGDKQNEFTAALDTLLGSHESVDIFLLAHANHYYRWVSVLPEERRKHIRIVYNTGCTGSAQCADWLSIGAKAYVGHPGDESISPVFYFFFLRRWAGGENLKQAVKESNALMLCKMNRIGHLSLGAVRLDEHRLNNSQAICFGDSSISISTASE